jgi:endonuclease YncB( thermonuclease family)
MMNIQHAFEEAKLKELMTKAVYNLANARERHGRAESNIGLFEERLSMIEKNRAMATKEKMAALEQLVETIAKFGEVETSLRMQDINTEEQNQASIEDREKEDAKKTSESNKFVENLMAGMDSIQGGQQQQSEPQQQM